jgi:hypothetical protein
MTAETRRMLRAARLGALSLALLATACGRGDKPGEESGATPDDVDAEASATVTEAEQQAFHAPADSSVTPQQIEAYLKTSLLQFDLVRREAAGFHEQAKRMEDRGKSGGVIAGLRNMADAASFITRFGDVVGGSYIRSARTLQYNPAEMEYVRERMGELGVYLAIQKPASEGMAATVKQIREQADSMRAQFNSGRLEGYTEDDVKNIEQNAADMEKSLREQEVSGSAMRNLEALHRARPNVPDRMWASVLVTSGLQGWAALSGLANPQDTTAQRQLTEWRTLYTDALNNKVSPGMENDSTPQS